MAGLRLEPVDYDPFAPAEPAPPDKLIPPLVDPLTGEGLPGFSGQQMDAALRRSGKNLGISALPAPGTTPVEQFAQRLLTTPKQAVEQGITTEEAIPWAADTALTLGGGGSVRAGLGGARGQAGSFGGRGYGAPTSLRLESVDYNPFAAGQSVGDRIRAAYDMLAAETGKRVVNAGPLAKRAGVTPEEFATWADQRPETVRHLESTYSKLPQARRERLVVKTGEGRPPREFYGFEFR